MYAHKVGYVLYVKYYIEDGSCGLETINWRVSDLELNEQLLMYLTRAGA